MGRLKGALKEQFASLTGADKTHRMKAKGSRRVVLHDDYSCRPCVEYIWGKCYNGESCSSCHYPEHLNRRLKHRYSLDRVRGLDQNAVTLRNLQALLLDSDETGQYAFQTEEGHEDTAFNSSMD